MLESDQRHLDYKFGAVPIKLTGQTKEKNGELLDTISNLVLKKYSLRFDTNFDPD